MYITFTWQRPAISSRGRWLRKEGPVAGPQTPGDDGLGHSGTHRLHFRACPVWRSGCIAALAGQRLLDGSLRRLGIRQTTSSGAQRAGGRFCRGRRRPGASLPGAKAPTRALSLSPAPACGLGARARRRGGPAAGGLPYPAQRSAARGARAKPTPAGRLFAQWREPMSVPAHPAAASARVKPSRSAGCARAASRLPRDGVLPSFPPAPVRQRAQGRRQPSGWRVDGIVVTCSDPAQRCRAAPAAALGEPVFAEW